MKQLVNFFGRQAKNQVSNNLRKPSRRQLRSESLEKRQLLAGDILAAHNYSIPEDVNNDWQVTPLDALLVLNHIAKQAGNSSLDGFARGELKHFVDVTGDSLATPLDALRVLNRIASGEAEDALLDLSINPRTSNDQAFSASAFNAATRELTVGVNEVFNLELLYTDLRGSFDRVGAFAIYADFLIDTPNVLEPVLTETQFVEISANIRDARAGTITFSLAGNPPIPGRPTTSTISFNVFTDDQDAPANEIRKALELFGYSGVLVTTLPGAGTDPLAYLIRFNDFSLVNQNLPNLVITANLTAAGGASLNVTSEVKDEPPLIPSTANPSVFVINPQAIRLNVNFLSRTFKVTPANPSGEQFFAFGGAQVGSFNPATGFSGVGANGPLLVNGFPDANAGPLPRPFDSFSIPVRLTQPVENLRIILDPASINGGTANLLYGSTTPVPIDLVQINLLNDPTNAADGTGILFVTAVQQGGEVTVAAADGSISATQNGSPVILNVLPLVTITNSTATPVITITTPPTRGTAVINGTTVTYTPTAGQIGADSFVYTATVNGVSDTGTIGVTISAPVITVAAGDGNLTAVQNGPAVMLNTLPLVAVSGSTATPVITITTQPTRGTVSVNGTNVVYIPTAGQIGADSFVYTATVGGVSDTGTISVAINAAVVTVSAADGNLTAVQNGSSVTLNVGPLVTVTGSTATPVITITTQPTRGSVSVSGTSVIYTPTAGQVGADSFVYTATVGGVSDTGTISVSINAPVVTVAAGDGNLTAVQNGTGVTLNVGPLVTVTGSTSTPVITIFTQPTRGTVTVNGTNVIYTPAAGQVGADSFVYRATVGGVSDTGTITVAINAPVISVTAANGNLTAVQNGAGVTLNVRPLVTVTGSTATPVITITTQPTRGTVTVNGTNVFYTPAAGQVGADSFVYTATVGAVSDTGTIAVTITPQPVVVTAANGNLVAVQNGPAVQLNLAALVSVTGSTATPVITITTQPTRGTVVVTNGIATYTPTAGQVGTDSFVYTATVGGVSDPGAISVNINAQPITVDAANGTLNAVENDGARTLNLASLVTVTGSTTTPTFTIVTGPTRGTASITGTTLTYTPSNNQFGSDSIVYRATVNGVSDTGMIAVTIAPFVAAPIARNDNFTALADTSTTFTSARLTANDSAARPNLSGQPPLVTAASAIAGVTQGTVVFNPTTNSVVYTPPVGFEGDTSFQYTMTSEGQTASATVFVSVRQFVPSTITGSIFTDYIASVSNPVRNGVRDSNEPALGGVPVVLTPIQSSIGAMPQRVLTTASGEYAFENVPPGTYEVSFDIPDTLIFGAGVNGTSLPALGSGQKFTIVIGEEGGLVYDGLNFTVLGRKGLAAGTGSLLVSQYLLSSPNSPFNSSRPDFGLATMIVNPSSGEQQVFELTQGFDGVLFAEIAIGRSGSTALLTLIMEDGTVKTALLSKDNGDFVVNSTRAVVQVFRNVGSMTFIDSPEDALQLEYGDYRDAVDQVLASGMF